MTTVVHGIPEALAALERRKVQAKLATPVAVKAGGEVVAKAAQVIAPKDKGRLAASITVEVDGEIAHVGSTVPYDRFVQRGTRYMDAQPYGEQAAHVAAPVVETAMAAVFKIAMK